MASDYLSADEVRTFVRALARDCAELRRLYAVGQTLSLRSRAGPTDGHDLLHEAIKRALSGDRRCPREVPFAAFLVETMRSLASAEAQKQVRHLSPRSDVGAVPLPAQVVDADAALDDARKLRAVHALFEDAPIALKVVEGIAEGKSGEELRASVGLDRTTYQTVRTFIRRRLQSRFPRGMLDD